MDPPEVTISNLSPSQQLASNVEGCRNALSRVLASAEQDLIYVPSPSSWAFVGRVLHKARRQARVRTPLCIDDAIDDGRTMEYAFVCYVESVSVGSISFTSRLVNGENSHSTTKWIPRSELSAMLHRANESQLDHKFRAVATKILKLDETDRSKCHDYWNLSNIPPQPILLDSIYEVVDLSCSPPPLLNGDDRCV